MTEKYIVVEIDGNIRSHIAINNKPDKYEKPKLFATKEDAQRWIDRHSYKYQSWKYEIMKEVIK